MKHSRSRNASQANGFTLVELMVVVAIIAILAAIALPAYGRYVIKARRTAAEGCLSEYSNYMERFYTTNLRYDKDGSNNNNPFPTLDCASAEQTGTYYDYATSTLSASAYSITATPKGPQTSDTMCGTLSITQSGERGADGEVSECWK